MNWGGEPMSIWMFLKMVVDRVALEAEGPLHPLGVDGARPHPLVDGDVPHHVASEGPDEVGHPGPVDEVAGQQELGDEDGQLRPVELGETGAAQPLTGAAGSAPGRCRS